MKQLLLAAVLALALLTMGYDANDCTVGGFAPGEHVLIYYTNPDGDVVPISGYADGNGEFNPCR